MQNFITLKILICGTVIATLTGCWKANRETAAEAISRHRNTLVDQVNAVGDGAPFFTVETLNPVWSDDSVTPIVRMPSLSLTDQDGVSRDQSFFTGKTTVLAFMFTSCNGFCPMIMQKLKGVERGLTTRSDVRYVAISVDPEVDTPSRLQEYAASHQLDTASQTWTLLTGTEPTIYSLARDTFASQVIRKPGNGPRDFVHAGHFYIIDKQGRLRGIVNGTEVDVHVGVQKVVRYL